MMVAIFAEVIDPAMTPSSLATSKSHSGTKLLQGTNFGRCEFVSIDYRKSMKYMWVEHGHGWT